MDAHTCNFYLPVELLVSVFACLSLQVRIAATHVCHSWRDISLGAPSALWAQISWDNGMDSLAILDARLARTGGALVDLRITLSITPPEGFKPALDTLLAIDLDAGLESVTDVDAALDQVIDAYAKFSTTLRQDQTKTLLVSGASLTEANSLMDLISLAKLTMKMNPEIKVK